MTTPWHLHPPWDTPIWHTRDDTRTPLWDIYYKNPWRCHQQTFRTYHYDILELHHHDTPGRCHGGTSLGHKTTASFGRYHHGTPRRCYQYLTEYHHGNHQRCHHGTLETHQGGTPQRHTLPRAALPTFFHSKNSFKDLQPPSKAGGSSHNPTAGPRPCHKLLDTPSHRHHQTTAVS